MEDDEILIDNIKNLINRYDLKMKGSHNSRNTLQNEDENVLAKELGLELLKTIRHRSVSNEKKEENKKGQAHIHLKTAQKPRESVENNEKKKEKKKNQAKRQSSIINEVIWSDRAPREDVSDTNESMHKRKNTNDWTIENRNDLISIKPLSEKKQMVINKIQTEVVGETNEESLNKVKQTSKESHPQLNRCNLTNFTYLPETRNLTQTQTQTSYDEEDDSERLNTQQDTNQDDETCHNRTYKDKSVEENFLCDAVTEKKQNVEISNRIYKVKSKNEKLYRHSDIIDDDSWKNDCFDRNLKKKSKGHTLFKHHSDIGDRDNYSETDETSNTIDSASSGQQFKEFMRTVKIKKNSNLAKNCNKETFTYIRNYFYDFCEFIMRNLIAIVTWRTPDGGENYWVNIFKCFFSALVNYTTSDYNKKMRRCLKNDKSKKLVRISKLSNQDCTRLNDKINNLKCKLTGKKKYISCNSEKLLICKS